MAPKGVLACVSVCVFMLLGGGWAG